jgi:alkylation response protein AidB-like acyl-CoA dehydrogenase
MTTATANLPDLGEPRGASFLWEPAGARAIMTPERFTDEQRQYAAAAREFADKEIMPRMREIETRKEGVMPLLLRKAGELGLLMPSVPEAWGGLGLDKTTTMFIAEQFAGVGSFSVSLGAHTGIGTLPIVYFGTDEQKRRFLPDLATGARLAAYALTEAHSGSDALAARTRATRAPDGGYLLTGSKQFITNAAFADVFTVFAKVDGDKFTAFLVERTMPGFHVGPEEHKMGIRGSSTCSLTLEDVKVPAANLLGEIGKGHRIAFNILNVGRIKLGVGTVGGCKAALALSARYAKERHQFGRPIASFGLVSKKLAEMALATFVAETMGYRTTGLVDERLHAARTDAERVASIEEYTIEASIIKIAGSEALDLCADECVQIHGGYGFIEEYQAERLLRDSRINRIFEGTNEINRLIVPGTLLKRAARGEVPLLGLAAEVRRRTAAHDLPRLGAGPLAHERHIAERSKWLALYVTSVAVETYQLKVADQQEILGEIADMLAACYAWDSVVARAALVLDDAKLPEAHRATVRDMLTAYAPIAHGHVVQAARRVLMDSLDEHVLDEHLAAVEAIRHVWPARVLEAKRRIAQHVLEKDGYPL